MHEGWPLRQECGGVRALATGMLVAIAWLQLQWLPLPTEAGTPPIGCEARSVHSCRLPARAVDVLPVPQALPRDPACAS